MSYMPPPLEYSPPQRRQRPGIVTAIGVISQIVGWLGAVSYGVVLMMSTMPSSAYAPRPPRTAMTPATASGTATTTPTTAQVVTPFSAMSRASFLFLTITYLLGLALAIGLIGLGIMVLRNSRWAVDMHWWYVRLKILLVIIGSMASMWMTWSMMQGMNTMMAATPVRGNFPPPRLSETAMFGIMSISTVLSAAISLAYPVSLIFALRSRAVRDYTSAVRE